MGRDDKAPEEINGSGTEYNDGCSEHSSAESGDRDKEGTLPSRDRWMRGFQLVDHWRFVHQESLMRMDIERYSRRRLARRRAFKLHRRPGEILAVTEDVALLFALREKIHSLQHCSLRWENHFWHAVASLSRNRYAGLLLDLRMPSCEDKFALDFLEEYGALSSGIRIFLSDAATPEITKGLLRRQGGLVLEGRHSIESIVTHLRLQ